MKQPEIPEPPGEFDVRPLVRQLSPYAPGEQPKGAGWIKLNTNENPYPPSPKVLKAVRAAVDGRLRLYPDPTASTLRARLAKLHGCAPDHILVGNGSDEALALAVRAFVEPLDSVLGRSEPARATVQFFHPSYSLYPILAAIHGARPLPVRLDPDFQLPSDDQLAPAGWNRHAALTLITTPNAPSGRGYGRQELERVCEATSGVVVLDEAYADFAREHALPLALRGSRVLVARTFSKAYSLCAQRVGYLVGPPPLIEAMGRIKDSYNVNTLGQTAALATLADLAHCRRNLRRIIATRERLRRELLGLGFEVAPSEANFLLVRPPGPPAEEWLSAFRRRRILVRWFNLDELRDRLRITVGTDAEADALLRAASGVLRRRA